MKMGERIRNLRPMSNPAKEKMIDRERDPVVIDHG